MAELKLEVILDAVDRMTQPVRDAMRATQGLSAAAKASKLELDNLHKTQAKIESYKSQQQQLDTSRLKVELSRKSLAALEKQIQSAEKPTKTLIKQQQREEKQLQKLMANEDRQVVSLEKVKTELRQVGVYTDHLRESEQRIQREITASQKKWQRHAPELIKNKTALQELNKAQRNISSYQKMQAALKQSEVALQHQRQEVKSLKQSYAIANAPVRKLTREIELSAQKVEVLQRKFDQGEHSSARFVARLEKAKTKLSHLQTTLSKTKQPTQTLINALQKAENKLQLMSHAEQQQINKLRQLSQNLENAGLDSNKLENAQRKLTGQIHRTNQTIGEQIRKLDKQNTAQRKAIELARKRAKMQEKLQMYQDIQGVAYPAVAAGGAIAYAAQKTVMPSASHQDMVKDIAITGNLSKVAELKLAETLRKVALDTNQEQVEINKGVQILVANGMKAVEAGNYAQLLGDTATATRAQMEDISNLTFSLKNAFKIEGADEMKQAMNNLVHAGKQGQFELKEMARYFPSLAANMASMGATGQQAAKELAMTMQAARKSAGTSQEAAANTANWFSHMTAGSTIEHFEKVGIDFKAEIMKRTQTGKQSALFASFEVFDDYIDKLTKGKTLKIRDKKGKVTKTLGFRKALEAAKKSGNQAEIQQIISRFGLSEILQDMQTTNFYLAMRQNKEFLKKGMASYDTPNIEALDVYANDLMQSKTFSTIKDINGNEVQISEFKKLVDQVKKSGNQEDVKKLIQRFDLEKVTSVGYTIERDKQRRMNSPIEQFKAAKIQFTDTLTDFGNAVLPELIPLIKEITIITREVSEWAKENPELVRTIAKVTLAVGAGLLVFGTLATVIIGILGPLALARYALGLFAFKGGGAIAMLSGLIGWLIKSGVAVLGFAGRMTMMGGLLARVAIGAALGKLASGAMMAMRAFQVLGVVLMANPIVLIASAIAGAAYLIYKNWDTIKQWLGTFLDFIKPYFQDAWNFIKTLFSWTPLGMVISNWGTISPYFSELWAGIKSMASTAWEGLKTILSWTPLGMIITNWQEIFTWFKALPTKFLKFGENIMQGLADGISKKLAAVKNKIKSIGANISAGIRNGISSSITSVKNSAVSLANKTMTGFKKTVGIESPSKVFKGYGKEINRGLVIGIEQNKNNPVQKIKQLAQGVLAPFSKQTAKNITIGATLAGAMALPVSAQKAGQLFNPEQKNFIQETKQSQQDYQRSEQRVNTLLTPAPANNPAPASPINIKIEVHATPRMDEYALAELIEHKLRDGLRQSDYRRRHQLFDGYKL